MKAEEFIIEVYQGKHNLGENMEEIIRSVWNLSRNSALEEAAIICNKSEAECSSLWDEPGCWAHSASHCAELIREAKCK